MHVFVSMKNYLLIRELIKTKKNYSESVKSPTFHLPDTILKRWFIITFPKDCPRSGMF